MNFSGGAQFDPGFIRHLTAFVPTIEYMYSTIERFKNFGQKKLQFKMFYPKIQALLSNYIGFYLGCMLWAAYIKGLDNKPVLNNLCFGGEYSEAESLEEVNFVIEYIDKFAKDVKYYLGQNFSIDSSSKNILAAYAEFLKLNRGFTQVQTTNDLLLPDSFKPLHEPEAVLAVVEKVTETGDFTQFYKLYEKLL
ncbi:MAG: hypothetical protein LBJ74_04575 [Heliobacteriaceae bacterium]|nr:hypothetical protein [Heliobacteriaceae bacterium]